MLFRLGKTKIPALGQKLEFSSNLQIYRNCRMENLISTISVANREVTTTGSLEHSQNSLLLNLAGKLGFLHLPFETRLQIYHLLIPQNNLIDGETPVYSPRDKRSDSSSHQNSIFLLNKQISSEALDILYGSNIFHLVYHNDGESHLQKNFCPQNLQRMRKIAITARSYGGCYHTSKQPNEELWGLALPNLNMLRFVVDQPLEFDSRHWESYDYECSLTLEEKNGLRRTFQGKLARWIGWIGEIAEFFGARIEERTQVEVDVNGLCETKEVFARCLPGFEEVHDIELGDYMFKRGRYSREYSGEEWCCSLFD